MLGFLQPGRPSVPGTPSVCSRGLIGVDAPPATCRDRALSGDNAIGCRCFAELSSLMGSRWFVVCSHVLELHSRMPLHQTMPCVRRHHHRMPTSLLSGHQGGRNLVLILTQGEQILRPKRGNIYGKTEGKPRNGRPAL